jgi:hypothetical protein
MQRYVQKSVVAPEHRFAPTGVTSPSERNALAFFRTPAGMRHGALQRKKNSGRRVKLRYAKVCAGCYRRDFDHTTSCRLMIRAMPQ